MKRPVVASLIIALLTVTGASAQPAKGRPPWRVHTVGWLMRQTQEVRNAYMHGIIECFYAEFNDNPSLERISNFSETIKYSMENQANFKNHAPYIWDMMLNRKNSSKFTFANDDDNSPQRSRDERDFSDQTSREQYYEVLGYIDYKVLHDGSRPHHTAKYYYKNLLKWYGYTNQHFKTIDHQLAVPGEYTGTAVGDVIDRLIEIEPGNHPFARAERPPPALPTPSPSPPDADVPAHDGKWWMALGEGPQEQAAVGFYDCMTTETDRLKRPIKDDFDLNLLPGVITYRYLSDDDSERLKPDVALYQTLYYPRAVWRRPLPIGLFYPERHGMLDGSYWYRTSRRSFLEGYLLCLNAAGKPAPFELVSAMEQRLNNYYGIYPSPKRADDAPLQVARPYNRRRWRVKIGDLIDDFIQQRPRTTNTKTVKSFGVDFTAFGDMVERVKQLDRREVVTLQPARSPPPAQP